MVTLHLLLRPPLLVTAVRELPGIAQDSIARTSALRLITGSARS